MLVDCPTVVNTYNVLRDINLTSVLLLAVPMAAVDLTEIAASENTFVQEGPKLTMIF